jgi:hypothetical protein
MAPELERPTRRHHEARMRPHAAGYLTDSDRSGRAGAESLGWIGYGGHG